MKYAKLINNKLVFAPKNFITPEGYTIFNFDKNEPLLYQYGFKRYVPSNYYIKTGLNISYEETEEEIREVVTIPSDYERIRLEKLKEQKIAENDEKRDIALYGGVTYQNVLFDSDTDQKINLSEQNKRMSDSDTVLWYGMNGGSLLCTKADIQAIGDLIYNLTAFVWGMNDYIKEQIASAETIEEVEAIEINYENPGDI